MDLLNGSQIEKEGCQQWWPYQKFYLEGRKNNRRILWTEVKETKKPQETRRLYSVGKFSTFQNQWDLIKNCIEMGSGEDDLILDFFAGSGTTAHAILEMNEEDGGNRKFICVQMPEALEETAKPIKRAIAPLPRFARRALPKSSRSCKRHVPNNWHWKASRKFSVSVRSRSRRATSSHGAAMCKAKNY